MRLATRRNYDPSIAATLVNPNGLQGVLYPLGYAARAYTFQQFVAE